MLAGPCNPDRVTQVFLHDPGRRHSAHDQGRDGQHFEALIVSAAFAGKNLVQQHQMVYQALGANMRDAVIHALSLRTLTPEQFSVEQGR
jgi:stress-induced morphogen